MQERLRHLYSNVQLRRYIVVGGTGTLIDIGLYSVLRFFGMWHWLALSISFGTGVALGFILTRLWVFQRRGSAWEGQLVRFLLVVGIMYFVNGFLMEGLYTIIPAFVGRSFFVRGGAAVISLPISFALHRRVSFA